MNTAVGIAGGMTVAVAVDVWTFIFSVRPKLTVGWNDDDVTAKATEGVTLTMVSGAGLAARNRGIGQSSADSTRRYSNLPYRL